MEYSPKKMKDLLNQYQFDFKKAFGQNFIVDENVIRSIIRKACIDSETLVIEIGPGAGSLTYYLAQVSKNVLCYELDTRLRPILQDVLKGLDHVKILYEDFLKANVVEDLKAYSYKKLYVVANLPYYVTTPIIVKLIEDSVDVDKMVLMVQKEVGNRFKALPGSREYSSLSVFLNYYFDVHKLLDVSKHVFLPKPNVDSIVIELKKKNKHYDVLDLKLFFQLIRDSFKQKRKTLRNNLSSYDLEKILVVLSKYGYDLSVRAEQLSLEIFVEMANILS